MSEQDPGVQRTENAGRDDSTNTMSSGDIVVRIVALFGKYAFVMGVILAVGGMFLALLDGQSKAELRLWFVEVSVNTGALLAISGVFVVARCIMRVHKSVDHLVRTSRTSKREAA